MGGTIIMVGIVMLCLSALILPFLYDARDNKNRRR